MKEKIFYLRWPKEIYYTFLPQISTSSIPILPREHYYLPDRNLEISALTDLLPCSIELEDIEENKRPTPTLDLTKSALSKPTSIWDVRKLEKIPKDAVLIEVEKEKIDKVMNAYEKCENANKAFGKEFQEYKEKHPNLPNSFKYKPKVNPFVFQENFYKICEETFLKNQ